MPRLARLDAPGVLHHVMGRGIEKRKVFLDDQDRSGFLSRLAVLGDEKWMDIYAWALLPNHFHLLCRTREKPLATSMRKLLTGYVVNFNIRHRRHGHLFQNRYKSIVCQEESYLTELVRYIHLNLLRAGSRRQEVIRARKDFSQLAVKLLGYAGAEAGRYLGVTSSCVTRVASQEERLEDLQVRYKIR